MTRGVGVALGMGVALGWRAAVGVSVGVRLGVFVTLTLGRAVTVTAGTALQANEKRSNMRVAIPITFDLGLLVSRRIYSTTSVYSFSAVCPLTIVPKHAKNTVKV